LLLQLHLGLRSLLLLLLLLELHLRRHVARQDGF
jgi:hypothetical protein